MRYNDDEMEAFGRDELAPVEMLNALFDARGWAHEQINDDEITAEIKGSWSVYQMRIVWREEDNALQIIIFPELKAPADKLQNIYTALGLINEQLWIGHFDLWSSNHTILFRNGSLLPPNGMLSIEQAQTMIDVAIDEVERFYPVFQFIIWGGKSPEDALAAAMVDTQGEA
ncbi:hypothetical protein LPB140_03890 [Sphingorhabdus lutea]|uniref:YbjN domain-containing protein n=1 Tax=Sphingorhabdus lutea TaxID=1913578 RepID=A0A1L3JES3_9SPHN|nr:YbjN domain-containing protein [Sphingorhabdus lutea]APG63553.1 hypothetical protein LPB140_03890 [Sphingorhabdus lutea]